MNTYENAERRRTIETVDPKQLLYTIFVVQIEQRVVTPDGETEVLRSKLNLVDLAGSEKWRTAHLGRQPKEGQITEMNNINQSLSCLGKCISALSSSNRTHVPFRESKLTRLLQDSLGGNTKTVMIANVGPSEYNYDETINTLRYASRAKNIKNKPRINEDPKDALLREY